MENALEARGFGRPESRSVLAQLARLERIRRRNVLIDAVLTGSAYAAWAILTGVFWTLMIWAASS